MKKLACVLCALALYIPITVHAETVLRIGENISVNADQIVDGDYYVSVGPLSNTSMSGTVTEDMYAFGGMVTANGSIGGDLTIVSGATQLHATVTDDVRILAGDVILAEHVGGDLFVIGGSLEMLSSASVGGDVIFFGGDAVINGKVGGSILGTSERIRINAEVGEDVDIKTALQFTLGEDAAVAGAVRYTSPEPVLRAQNAAVEGEIVRNEEASQPKGKTGRDMLIPVFITLFAALSLYLLFKKELQFLAEHIEAHPIRSGVCGIAVAILGPIVSLLLIATILGVFIGVAGLALTVLAYVLGYALSGVILGAYLSKFMTKKLKVTLPWILAGTFLLHLFLIVPFIGPLLVVSIFALTVGGLALSVYKLLV